MSAFVKTKLLPSGHAIPTVALGVYQSEPGSETYDAVISALKLGYRHIDTATTYHNEEDVGKAIRDSGIPRHEVFVTSKFAAPHNRWSYDEVVEAVRLSNRKLGLEYIDLYLLHAPFDGATRADAWKALEDMQTEGVVRDIGVSNFGAPHLQKLSETWRVKAAVNQVELHPWLARADTVKFCEEQGILMEAYSPLARAQKMHDRTLKQVGSELGATSAQVLIAWSLAKGFVTLPKSVTESRIKENLEAVKLELTAEQMEKLNGLDQYFVTSWDPIKQHAVSPLSEGSSASPFKSKLFPSGHAIPTVALSVYQSEPGSETYDAVISALKLGYRHIDTATTYHNEEDVGKAIRDSGIPRHEVFVTSKFAAPHNRWSYDKVVEAVRLSNRKLGLEYIDLYLLHAPFDGATRADAWKALEDMQTEGVVRDIGVSNFGAPHLQKLSETWRVKAAVNQVELHPWLARADTVKFCEEQGILMEAYSPLARAQKMHDRTLKQVGSELGATSAQVLIAWSLAKGFVTLPKSVTESRIKENLEAAELELTAEQMEKLNGLDEHFVTWFGVLNLRLV